MSVRIGEKGGFDLIIIAVSSSTISEVRIWLVGQQNDALVT
jgi:hypothetical protein